MPDPRKYLTGEALAKYELELRADEVARIQETRQIVTRLETSEAGKANQYKRERDLLLQVLNESTSKTDAANVTPGDTEPAPELDKAIELANGGGLRWKDVYAEACGGDPDNKADVQAFRKEVQRYAKKRGVPLKKLRTGRPSKFK